METILSTIQKATNLSPTEARKYVENALKFSRVLTRACPERTPYDYQTSYLDDHKNRFIVVKKCRQIGWSQVEADKGVLKAVCIPNYTKIFLSMSLDDAKEKIQYAHETYAQLQDEFGSLIPPKTHENRTEIRLRNRSRLISVFVPRGKAKADLSLDEFAHYQDPRRVYVAAMPILSRGGRISIASTPLHSQTLFNDIFEGRDGKYTGYKRVKIFWWDCPEFCNDVRLARQKVMNRKTGERYIQTEHAVDFFGTNALKMVYENMLLEDFQQEFECYETDDEAALLPWELIVACTPTGEDAIDKYETLEELKRKTRDTVLFAGYDVGRHKDLGELTIFEDRDGILFERFYQTFDRVSFNEQESFLDVVMSLPNIMKLVIDKTGMGEQMAENLHSRHHDRVMPLDFTQGSKQTMATQLKMYMQKGKVRFYPDKHRNFQMHSIKKDVTSSGKMRYIATLETDSAHKKYHHADVFWSRALGIYGHADMVALGRPNFRFITIEADF